LKAVLRSDYQPPAYWIDEVELEFDLAPHGTLVTAQLRMRRNPDRVGLPLELDGEKMELKSLAVDGTAWPADSYEVTDEQLVIRDLPDEFCLQTQVSIDPVDNKSLYGLYQSSGNFCTQCEAMGFRRITYFLDRPDVLARYKVTLRADSEQCPVMLSNGNRISDQTLEDGRREVVWEDPHLKPSYLFALVSGDLRCHRGTFVTRSGRAVELEIWVEPENINACEHALRSLQKSMKWDEDVFGLEYDLDIYMIVAVNDFNMGAMENKGLNVFNSKYVLASPETATDDDYLNVESVIAHEYFHNWTGNRVTCRDWFQLTLKEGLTVVRDQQFTADQTSAAVKRIDDVVSLRSRQLAEDAGPMAHPIRPESYISMDNFYTATVYDKGAEIIRIYHTLLGVEGFRRGMDLYFERHDGAAVTCDDFRSAMADANNVSLDLLDRWYSQPGTPTLEVSSSWDEEHGNFRLDFAQSYPDLSEEIPGAVGRKPVPIPIEVGLMDAQGKALSVRLSEGLAAQRIADDSTVLLLEEAAASYTFTGLASRPRASVLRGYSAPVTLRLDRTDEELAFLMAHDQDAFSRWDAGQTLATNLILRLAEKARADEPLSLSNDYCAAISAVVSDETLDGAYKSLLLTLPSERVLGQSMQVCDPDAIHTAREFVRRELASALTNELTEIYTGLSQPQGYSLDQDAINGRRLKNTVLAYLSSLGSDEAKQLVVAQYDSANNMTDSQAALRILLDLSCPEREAAIASFYDRWKQNPLVLDKWFTLQAISKREETLQRVVELTHHPDFQLTNPNRVRSLLGAFSQNQVRFHAANGAGYRQLADFVLKIDADNPQLASRLISAFNDYRRFDESRQALMRSCLEQIAGVERRSKDVAEIVERALKF
jgi:aminopeptidase N